MDQRGAGEIAGLAKPELLDQLRTAERAQALRQERFDLPAIDDGRASIGNGEIEANGFEIAQVGDGRQDPRLKPFGGKARTARDEQMIPLRLGRHQPRRAHDRSERALDLAGIEAAGIGEHRAAGVPGEDTNAEEILELVDVVADRGGRHSQFLGGAAEAAVSRRGFECRQRPERRHFRPLR